MNTYTAPGFRKVRAATYQDAGRALALRAAVREYGAGGRVLRFAELEQGVDTVAFRALIGRRVGVVGRLITIRVWAETNG